LCLFSLYIWVNLMTDIKRIGSSGIHTVEGNVAGSRAAKLTKAREEQSASYEATKSKIKEQNTAVIGKIDDKFNVAADSAEQEFRRRTVGLVTAYEFRQARLTASSQDAQAQEHQQREDQQRIDVGEKKKMDRAEKRKKMASTLSFDADGEDEPPSFVPKKSKTVSAAMATDINLDSNVDSTTVGAAEESSSAVFKKKSMKNPDVDTSFLPDKDRDEMLEKEKLRLRQEWIDQQEIIKNEVSGHCLAFLSCR
jgi:protein FAM50